LLARGAAKAIRATQPRIRKAPPTVRRAQRSPPEPVIVARTAKKPKVAAYLKANREGKLEPEGGRNHRTISREGHGLAMAGLSLLPRAPLPATAYYLIEKFYLEGMVASFLIIPNLIRVE